MIIEKIVKRVYSSDKGKLLKSDRGNIRLKTGVEFFIVYSTRFLYVSLSKDGPYLRFSEDVIERLLANSTSYAKYMRVITEKEIVIDRSSKIQPPARTDSTQNSKTKTPNEIYALIRKFQSDSQAFLHKPMYSSFKSKRERSAWLLKNSSKVKKLLEKQLYVLLDKRLDSSAHNIKATITKEGIVVRASTEIGGRRWLGLELSIKLVNDRGIKYTATIVQEQYPVEKLKLATRTPIVLEFFKNYFKSTRSLKTLGLNVSSFVGPFKMIFGGYKPDPDRPEHLTANLFYVSSFS